MTWTIGAFGGGLHFVQGIRGEETDAELRADVVVLAERILLAAAAAFAFWAIRRRWSAGRWVAVGLGCIVCYRLLPSLLYSWRALRGDLLAPAGLIAYSSPTEATPAFIINVGILCLVVALVFQLALGRRAARYFALSRVKNEPPAGG